MPDRKSFTSDCAPKPTATPTMPALASSGPIGRPTTSRIIRAATLDDHAGGDAAQHRRHGLGPLPASLRVPAGCRAACRSVPLAQHARARVPSAAPAAIRRITRCTSQRISAASSRMMTIEVGFASSQSDDSATHRLSVVS